MFDSQPEDRASYQFKVDTLPATKRPVVAMEPAGDSELTNGATLFMSLDDGASLEDARRLADNLNSSVRWLGYVRMA